jgi:plastocyanin
MRTRRELLHLAGLGGAVLASQLAGCFSSRERGPARPGGGGGALAVDDFFFLQLSDTHIGFAGPPNPEAAHTLERAVARIAGGLAAARPAFIVVTGDLTHTTEDDAERRRRLARFAEIIAPLGSVPIKLIPGEHDASLDAGAAFRERFGDSRWSFAHQGVHFVGIDNVSDPHGAIGDDGLAWLEADLATLDRDAPIVVFAHRPLFDLYPSWDWATQDGAKALAILGRYRHVTVFYGHIHQDHHDQAGGIEHHAARSLIFPLPAPGSVPEKKPVPWDAAHPFAGLGWRRVDEPRSIRAEIDLAGAAAAPAAAGAAGAAAAGARKVPITAAKFRFDPSEIALALGEQVVFELSSRDRTHGFAIPDFGISAGIKPGEITRVPFTASRAGTFAFRCDVFCGGGHEDMTGRLVIA